MYIFIFFCHVLKGRQFSCLPVCLLGGQSLPKIESTLLGEQIFVFKELNQVEMGCKMKIKELLPLKVFPFTLRLTLIKKKKAPFVKTMGKVKMIQYIIALHHRTQHAHDVELTSHWRVCIITTLNGCHCNVICLLGRILRK